MVHFENLKEVVATPFISYVTTIGSVRMRVKVDQLKRGRGTPALSIHDVSDRTAFIQGPRHSLSSGGRELGF